MDFEEENLPADWTGWWHELLFASVCLSPHPPFLKLTPHVPMLFWHCLPHLLPSWGAEILLDQTGSSVLLSPRLGPVILHNASLNCGIHSIDMVSCLTCRNNFYIGICRNCPLQSQLESSPSLQQDIMYQDAQHSKPCAGKDSKHNVHQLWFSSTKMKGPDTCAC